MNSHTERLNELIREHTRLSKAEATAPEQDVSHARVKEIRQELVSILRSGLEK
jgi:hypothetical protein